MRGAILAGILAATVPVSANSRPVTDCPNRDAPFSIGSPFIDLLLSPSARAILDRETQGRLAKLPARFLSTQPPTFAAVLTMREVAGFTGIPADRLATIDGELRMLPVSRADRIARCARYDNEVPDLRLAGADGAPRVLVFGKINGFKDVPGFDAAQAMLERLAQSNGWVLATTDKGGAFNSRTLRQFDAVIWNNISGDVLTLSQRRAFRRYLERGGGFVALHGSAGDPNYFWDWYADSLIGTRFIGHTMAPQFPEARIVVSGDHPVAQRADLPAEWRMADEWYSFRTNPASKGARIVLSLDESTYRPVGPMGIDIRMGEHPLAWTNCIGRGRMFYSAIGHKPEVYAEHNHVRLVEAAVAWAASDREACKAQNGQKQSSRRDQ